MLVVGGVEAATVFGGATDEMRRCVPAETAQVAQIVFMSVEFATARDFASSLQCGYAVVMTLHDAVFPTGVP